MYVEVGFPERRQLQNQLSKSCYPYKFFKLINIGMRSTLRKKI